MVKIITILLLLICLNTQATNRYVAKTGSNSNSGTYSSPYLTIAKALSVALAGDTVFVKEGTYNESVSFPSSGTEGNPIVLKNYGSDNVVIDAQATRNYCIYAIKKNYLSISGINCQNAVQENIHLETCNHIEIMNMTSTLPVYSTYAMGSGKGIYIGGVTDWGSDIILKNVQSIGGLYPLLIGAKMNGISVIGGRYSHGSIDGINVQQSGMTIRDTATISRNIIVDGVETDHNLRQGINTWGVRKATFKNFHSHDNAASGVQIENFSYNIVIEDFISESNCLGTEWTFETGIWIDDTDGAIVRRGIMRNNQTGFRVSGSRNVLAYNLLIYSNQDGASGGMINSSGVNFYSNPSSDANPSMYVCDVKLFNSVIDANSSSTSQRGAIVLQGEGNYTIKNCIISNEQASYDIFRIGTNTFTSDYNLFYNTRALRIYNLNTSITFSAYKSATGQDGHSLSVDPKINTEYKPDGNSPVINMGANVGLTTDFSGNKIVGLPDIGAFEYIETIPVEHTNLPIYHQGEMIMVDGKILTDN